jgi:ATP-dependent metalloprotease
MHSILFVQVKELVKSAYARAKKILMQHEKDLHKLAKELLDKETLSGEQIKKLLNISQHSGQTTAGSS